MIENPSAVGNPDETPVVRLGPGAARLLRAVLPAAPARNNRVIPARIPDGAVVEVMDADAQELGLSIMHADPTSAHDDVTVGLARSAVRELHAALGAWLDRS